MSTGAQGHFGALFATSPEGIRIATADETRVTVGDSAAGTAIRTLLLVVPTSEHYQLSFSDTGDALVVVSSDASLNEMMVQTWDVARGELETFNSLPIMLGDSSDVALSPDWQILSVSYEDGRVDLWDVANQEVLLTLTAHGDAVVDAEFSLDGTLLAAAGRDGIIHVWDVAATLAAASSSGSADPVYTIDGSAKTQTVGGLVHVEPIGNTGLALGYLGAVDIWSLDDTNRPHFVLQGETKLTRDMATNHDLTQLMTGGQDGTAHLWDLATGAHLLKLAQHPSPIDDLAFSPDARQAITLDRDGLLRMWDTRLSNLGEQSTLSVDLGVFDGELSPDGNGIALGNAGGPASIWDRMTSERVAFLPGDFGGVYRLAYSPDGRLLATVGSDNKLRLWNTQSGTVTATLEGHGPGLAGGLFPGIMDVAFSPDGTRILTASSDGTARLWDAAGQPLAFLEGHTGGAVGGLQPRQRPHPHQR